MPTSDPEIEFQKNLSEELVFAWQDAPSPEVQAGLERALFNVGVEPIGQRGDIVEFDGITQHTEDDVLQGDIVEIVLPGWQLVNRRGKSLIARARVNKSTRSPASKEVSCSSNTASEEAANDSQSEPRMEEEHEKQQDQQPVAPSETSLDDVEGTISP